jgi:phospholipase C
MANGNGLASVNSVVMLMLENRSFDHMLGFPVATPASFAISRIVVAS